MNRIRGKCFWILLIAAALLLPGCGKKSYRDGVYTGKSGADEMGAWGEVTVTIKDGSVADCEFIIHQKDGTLKDEDYGKVNGEISNLDYYTKAQFAVRAMERYASSFRETGDLKKVDAVSGATVAFNQFTEAAGLALKKAAGGS